jgi:eukaryotic-like serine/threonine-protein kinase
MNPTKWKTIKETFSALLDLPENERAEFLERETDEEIRLEVEKLLAAHEKVENFIDKPILIEQGVVEDEMTDNFIGRQIENYRIAEKIGVGGMGAVYLAERVNSDFKQKLALKIIKRGMDSEAILKRFARERKILSTLKHPNIAQLLDGGISSEGLPFFVMEFVDGKPLNQFCRENNLSLEKHLKIFCQICAAVEYAHKNLIIHRDLKPSNVLVTTDGTPKLLDFGIAKLLSDEETDATATQAKMFTPEYASPEQILGKNVTTATDVYSLGVILYELLTRHRPFDVRGKSFEEIVKSVCETEPPKPSETLENQNLTTENEPETFHIPKNLLRGDLDNIILKALCKEPLERYGSVRQLSEDISRFLRGLPVLARPQTFKYRFGKYVKRHKAGVFAAALVLFSLIGGISVATWQAIVAKRERAKAERRFAQVRSIAKNVMFDYHDSILKLPRSTEVREKMLADSIAFLNNLAAESENSPDILREIADGYERVGSVQSNIYESNLNKVNDAVENFRKALSIRQSLVESNPQNIDDRFALAVCYSKTADSIMLQGNESEGQNLYQSAFDIYEKLAQDSPDNLIFQNGLAQGYFDLGFFNYQLRETEKALSFYEKSLKIRESLNSDSPNNALYMRNLAIALKRIGQVHDKNDRYGESIGLYRKAVELDEARLKFVPDDAQTKRDLSVSYRAIGFNSKQRKDFVQAWNYSQKSLDILTELAKDDPVAHQPDIANGYRLLGDIKSDLGEYEAAIEIYKQSIAVSNAIISDYHGDLDLKQNLTIAHENLANALEKLAAKKQKPEFHRQGCQEFRQSLSLWEEIQSAKKLLHWQETAVKRIQQNLEKCVQKIQ